MEGKKNKLEKIITIILVVIFGVGIAGHSINLLKDLMLLLTPFVLLISSLLVLLPVIKNKNKKLIYWLCGIFILTFLLEVAGVKTGIVFGEYFYREALGLKILEVPVIIGVNWVLVIGGAIKLSEKFSDKIYLKILITGLLAVLFDYWLEPVAVKLNYWNWIGGDIPFQNYAAWFIIALILAGIYFLARVKIESKLFERYYLIQLSFFFLLNLTL